MAKLNGTSFGLSVFFLPASDESGGPCNPGKNTYRGKRLGFQLLGTRASDCAFDGSVLNRCDIAALHNASLFYCRCICPTLHTAIRCTRTFLQDVMQKSVGSISP